jgi:hypothetical protein
MPRPAYLDAGTGCPRPSTITAEARDSDVYRCRRLRGLLNLYHWAMEYSLHCASDWKLGESPYSFTFTEGDLWKLGIETVGDLASSSCRAIAQSVHAEKRGNSSEFGSFNPRSLTLVEPPQDQPDSAATGKWNPRYTVKSTSRAGSDATPLLFDEKDLVGPVRFYHPELDDGAGVDWQERIPLIEISPRLRNASNCAEKFLASCGAKWNGPFFLNFERARELLKHLDAKRIDSKSALADLEQHRLECVAQVELALRQAFEDEARSECEPTQSAPNVVIRHTAPVASIAKADGVATEEHSSLVPLQTHLVAELSREIGVSTRTLNKYAKAAGVTTPRQGQRDYRYSEEDRTRILAKIVESCVDPALVASCRQLQGARNGTDTEIKPKAGN